VEAAHYSAVLIQSGENRKADPANGLAFLFFSGQIYLLGWQAAGVRDVVAVSREPPIAEMDHAIETGEAEKRVERPRPPDFPRDEQIDIRSGNQLPIGREQSNVREQFFARHIYLVSDPRFIE
jgi:hypothetical protein